MKDYFLMLIVLILCLLTLIGCNTTKSEGSSVVNGVVTNSNNEPISGAKIVFSYGLEELERFETYIRFMIVEPSNVKIWITKHAESDTISVLMDEYVDSGSHWTVWDGKNNEGKTVVSDAYDYHLLINNDETVKTFLILYDYDRVTCDEVADFEAMAVTNISGKYSISTEKLLMFKDLDPIPQISDQGTETGVLLNISHYAKVWALHADYEPVFIDSIFIREGRINKINLKFED